jgi:hypothetical protein
MPDLNGSLVMNTLEYEYSFRPVAIFLFYI